MKCAKDHILFILKNDSDIIDRIATIKTMDDGLDIVFSLDMTSHHYDEYYRWLYKINVFDLVLMFPKTFS